MGRCELTSKSPVVKNLVSHSNRRVKSIANPNIQKKRVFSRVLNQMVTLNISTTALRSMEHVGGLDTYILRQSDECLSKRALSVRNRIKAKLMKAKKS